jgi:hypothetical protein
MAAVVASGYEIFCSLFSMKTSVQLISYLSGIAFACDDTRCLCELCFCEEEVLFNG